MKNKCIRVFLGGYVNSINAQNLNCRALAVRLDKEQFDIGVMTYPGASLSMGAEFDNVKKFSLPCKLYRPLRWVRYITYLRGLLWCDVAYLPKGDIYHFTQRLSRLLGKKTFTTVEGVMDKETYEGMIGLYGSDREIRQCYNGFDKTFAITRYMSEANERFLRIKSNGVLYLGVDSKAFKVERKCSNGVKNLITIGSDLKRKRVNEFIELSRRFPDLSFHIVGGSPAFAKELDAMNLTNVTYHGRLNHAELAQLLAKMDLHVFPSRSEGFPKVTLETAAAGVPSIVYGDYGASEWITTGQNGFVVNTFDEIVDIITYIKDHPKELTAISAAAITLADSFDWSRLVKDWEKVIKDLAEE